MSEEQGATMNREVELPQDIEREQLSLLVKTGTTQGLSKEQFNTMLDLLELRFVIKPPVYVPGSPRGWNAFHGGQADVCRFLKYSCGGVKYGKGN